MLMLEIKWGKRQMMKGKKELNYNRFEYYLRQCLDCDAIFKASSKKSKFCPICKEKRNVIKLNNSLKARGIIVKIKIKVLEENNDINKLDIKPFPTK